MNNPQVVYQNGIYYPVVNGKIDYNKGMGADIYHAAMARTSQIAGNGGLMNSVPVINAQVLPTQNPSIHEPMPVVQNNNPTQNVAWGWSTNNPVQYYLEIDKNTTSAAVDILLFDLAKFGMKNYAITDGNYQPAGSGIGGFQSNLFSGRVISTESLRTGKSLNSPTFSDLVSAGNLLLFDRIELVISDATTTTAKLELFEAQYSPGKKAIEELFLTPSNELLQSPSGTSAIWDTKQSFPNGVKISPMSALFLRIPVGEKLRLNFYLKAAKSSEFVAAV